VTPAIAVTGAAVAVAIGLIGGLFPSVRAARLPVAEALRAT
jgi:putative ABC transport system permease protein